MRCVARCAARELARVHKTGRYKSWGARTVTVLGYICSKMVVVKVGSCP